jgi:hypothetical protein
MADDPDDDAEDEEEDEGEDDGEGRPRGDRQCRGRDGEGRLPPLPGGAPQPARRPPA